MRFTDENLQQLIREHGEIQGKYQGLSDRFLSRGYNDARAYEHVTQGFLRRLETLVRCIDNVFKNIPPDQTDVPGRDELLDGAIGIQAFIFNVFGSIDNLAWIWVLEKHLKKADGSEISQGSIGLAPKYKRVRRSLSTPFQDYLKGLDSWFEYLENYRHALAHRIPLYIPPYTVPRSNEKAYRDFEVKKGEAVKRADAVGYDSLSAEQMKLVAFTPLIKHSFFEGSDPFVFHPQMMADFNTVLELGEKLLEELDR